jgi:cytochrome c oxidase assembly factor CtaG/cytochrome c2
MLVLSRLASLGLLLAATQPAFAQLAAAPDPREIEWSWDAWILTSLAIAALWYAAGATRLHRRLDVNRLVGLAQIAAYGAGLLTLFVVLLSPIDSIADQLFWVHMVQHLGLMLVAAPLLVMGRPAIAFLWAFGPKGRKRVGRFWVAGGCRRGLELLMHPVLVWLLFCGAFVVWHFPGSYQLALSNEGIHTIEHVCLLVAALMFWSVVIEPSGRRRLAYGPTLVLIMTAAILSGLPGALIALATRPLYLVHAAGDAAWGLTLLEDQQLAGLVMWIPGGVVYLAAAGWIFLKWLQQGDGQRAVTAQHAVAPVLFACFLPLVVGGCDDGKSQTTAIGNPHRGIQLILSYGCGGCHTVPGVDDANGMVGPPLTSMGRRIYIAGVLRNTSDNMVAWLRDPQGIVPGNVMPNMNINDRDAHDLAAYLSTLH